FSCNRGDEFCAGFVVRLVKHVRAGMSAEMLGVRWGETRALMVVEPPADFGRVRVLEIDDGVFVAIEKTGSPRLRGAMGHAGKAEFRCGIEFLLVKAVEKSCRGGPIKTAVVEAQPDAGHVVAMAPFSFFLPWQSRDKAF